MLRLLAKIPPWFVLLLILGGLVTWGLAPENANPLNPDALETVGSIIALCERNGELGPAEVRHCNDVRYLAQWCRTRGKEMCTLRNVYESIGAMGFNLPALNEPRP